MNGAASGGATATGSTSAEPWARRSTVGSARAAVSAAEAYEAQRLGLVEIERLMDELEAAARREVESDGRARLLPRRSPGYGEMPLALSREILDRLDATRKIGVALTESLSLVPTKSVTAICEVESKI